MEIVCGVYKIISPSGAVYIGQSVHILNRWRQYKQFTNNKNQRRLFNSFKKYGFEAHSLSIMHDLPIDVSPDVLVAFEQFCIDQYKESGHVMMNIRDAGKRGKHSDETRLKQSIKATGRKHTPQTLAKMSIARTGKPGNRLGHKATPEEIEKNRRNRLGFKHSEETKRKISVNHSKHNKGIPMSELSREKNRVAHLGKKASEETKLKMSLSGIGKQKTKEHNQKVSAALKLYHQRKRLNLSIVYNNHLQTFLL